MTCFSATWGIISPYSVKLQNCGQDTRFEPGTSKIQYTLYKLAQCLMCRCSKAIRKLI